MKRISRPMRAAYGVALMLLPWIILQFPSIDYYLDILVFAGIYTLITLGLTLLMGYAGQVSLGHAGFFGIGAYASAIFCVHYNWNPWFAMIAGAAIAGVVAKIVGTPSLKLQGHYLAMATLAFGIIAHIVFNEEIELTGGPDGMGDIPQLQILGYVFDEALNYYYLVWTFVFIAFLFSVNIIQSRTGRALRSIHTSEVAANAMGIGVSQYKEKIFILSAVFAAIAGSLYVHYSGFVNPSGFGFDFSVILLIMIMIGGIHDIRGAIFGTILITFLRLEWLEAFEELELLIFGIILLSFTIFLPDGLISIPQKVRGWFQSNGSEAIENES